MANNQQPPPPNKPGRFVGPSSPPPVPGKKVQVTSSDTFQSTPPKTMPVKPLKPVSGETAQPKPLQQGSVAIRTMRDDLSTPAQPAAAISEQPPRKPISTIERSGVSEGRIMPLPAKKTLPDQSPPSVVPPQKESGSASKVIGILVVLLILASAGGGLVWWWLSQEQAPEEIPGPTSSDSAQRLAAAEVIPANAPLILRYNVEPLNNRSQLQQVWNVAGSENAGAATVVAGNPAAFLTDTAINEFFYVLLEDEPRPYLVVPKTSVTDNIFSQSSVVQVLDVGQWYIVHPLDTAGYEAALTEGTAALGGGLPVIPESSSLQLMFDRQFLEKVHPDIAAAGDFVPAGETVVFNASVDAQAGRMLFTTNESGAFIPAPQQASVSQVAQVIPAEAELVYVGESFAADLPHWKTGVGNFIDGQALDAPLVKQFLDQFTSAYAYYEREGLDGVTDLGLVVALPVGLQGTLSVPDDGIETALRALVPPIVGRFGISPTVFNDNTYAGIPLRYTNILGNTQALDYALTDDYLLITSSKEGMFALLDTVGGQNASIANSLPWQAIVETEATTLGGQETLLHSIVYPSLVKLLPTSAESLFIGLSPRSFGDSQVVQGTLFFGAAAQ